MKCKGWRMVVWLKCAKAISTTAFFVKWFTDCTWFQCKVTCAHAMTEYQLQDADKSKFSLNEKTANMLYKKKKRRDSASVFLLNIKIVYTQVYSMCNNKLYYLHSIRRLLDNTGRAINIKYHPINYIRSLKPNNKQQFNGKTSLCLLFLDAQFY